MSDSRRTTDKMAWLALVQEEVLEPDLPIVDPHHHLWANRDRPNYQLHYLLEDLRADTGSGHNVEKTVFIECEWSYRESGPDHLRCIGETEAVASIAAQSASSPGARIAAIIGSCDLRLPSPQLAEALDAHEAAGQGLFRGIRHRIAHDPTGSATLGRPSSPEDLMGSSAFRNGVAELGRRGHVFEAWMYHHQLPSLVHLADAAPGTKIVLNHIGGPLGVGPWATRRTEIKAEWRQSMAALAAHDNIVVKLGGVGMNVYGMGWEVAPRPPTSDEIVAAYSDDIMFIIEHFGAQRCMFESNFPVDKMSCAYPVLWNAFKKMSVGIGGNERTALFSGTASHVYRV